MLDWLYSSSWVWPLFVLSVVMFVGSLIMIPWVLIRLPAHYFDERHPRIWLKDHHRIVRQIGFALKNLVGVGFVLAGIAMLVLPGQGLLTMLIGISFVDFPGKRGLERKIISVPQVLSTINAVRTRFGEAPLIVYPHCDLVEAPTVPRSSGPPGGAGPAG
jgi:hypothetical protein